MTRRVVRHAHKVRPPRRWLQAIEAASFLIVLGIVVVLVPLLWGPKP